MEVLQVQSDQASEEISLTSSEEAELIKAQSTEETTASKKVSQDSSSLSWEIREGVEITLTAQPEDTVVGEERLEITEVNLEMCYRCCTFQQTNFRNRMTNMQLMKTWIQGVRLALPQEHQTNTVLIYRQNLPLLILDLVSEHFLIIFLHRKKITLHFHNFRKGRWR